MIESVNTSQVLTAALKEAPQAAAVSAAPEPNAGRDGDADDFQTSRIVIDNLQNAVILEYRSSKTGEVVSQYPSQGQIAAFKRAEQSETPKPAEQATAAAAAPAQSDAAPAPQAHTDAAPAPVAASPAPQTSGGAAPAPAAPAGGDTSGGGKSVVV